MSNESQSNKALQALVAIICKDSRGVYRQLEKEAHLSQVSFKHI